MDAVSNKKDYGDSELMGRIKFVRRSYNYSGSEDSETDSKIYDYRDLEHSEIYAKNDDGIIEDMEQAAVDMKSDVEFDKTDEDKESDK